MFQRDGQRGYIGSGTYTKPRLFFLGFEDFFLWIFPQIPGIFV